MPIALPTPTCPFWNSQLPIWAGSTDTGLFGAANQARQGILQSTGDHPGQSHPRYVITSRLSAHISWPYYFTLLFYYYSLGNWYLPGW